MPETRRHAQGDGIGWGGGTDAVECTDKARMTSSPTIPQTLTVQYDVALIDGVTPSDPIDIATAPFDPNTQIFEVSQDAVGLIDPDLRMGGSMGDRWIPWIEVALDGASGTIPIAIVDGQDPSQVLVVIDPGTLVTPSSPLFREVQFRCPQGALIRVGDPAAPAGPGRVRLRILLECEDCGGGGGGTGPAGPPGPEGPPGPPGPEGPAGGGTAEMLMDFSNSVNFAVATIPLAVAIDTAAAVVQPAADLNVMLEFPEDAELTYYGYWQLQMPAAYVPGSPIVARLNVVGDGADPANASFSGQFERDTNVDLNNNTSFGATVTDAAIPITATGFSTEFTLTFTTGGQRDGILAGEPFRFRIFRNALDDYDGSVFFLRGSLEIQVA